MLALALKCPAGYKHLNNRRRGMQTVTEEGFAAVSAGSQSSLSIMNLNDTGGHLEEGLRQDGF